MHVANFGVFASAERNLIFGINDFDETLPGPWEWDLKRLVASIVASGRFLGADKNLCRESVMAAVSTYRKRMKEYAYMGNMELWYSTISEKDILKTLSPSARKGCRKNNQQGPYNEHICRCLDKLTDIVDDKYRLQDNAPFIVQGNTYTRQADPLKKHWDYYSNHIFFHLADDRKKLASALSNCGCGKKSSWCRQCGHTVLDYFSHRKQFR